MRTEMTLWRKIATFWLLGSLAAAHWLGTKHPWLHPLSMMFMLASLITILIDNWKPSASSPITAGQNIGTHIFFAVFFGIAIAYNLGHWYLVILVPVCAYFALTSFFLFKQARRTGETQTSLLQLPR
jgi:hypothetical protein